MADDIQELLNYIVTQYAVRDEQRAIDQDANAAEGGDAIAADKAQAVSRTEEQAADLAEPFREGLIMAWARRSQGDGTIQLDDRDPEQNRIADAMIQFLVSYDLAESHSEATGPRNYIYSVAVDWPRLQRIAQAAGVQLDAALADARS